MDACAVGAWFRRFVVRDERLLTPEDAVHRLTARADVAVFDPVVFAERGTVFEPNRLPRECATCS